jgi:hypothetical protein
VSERVGHRFRAAARAYLVYGIVYYVGGLYLVWHGVGVAGSMEGRRINALAFWAIAGLVPMLLIPYLITRPRAWFERWILCRRDFARVVAVLLAFRAFKVGQVIVHPHGGSVPTPWGGSITFQVGAAVFTVITVVALVLVAWAAWSPERAYPEAQTGDARAPTDSAVA